jgi:hypothetical protein
LLTNEAGKLTLEQRQAAVAFPAQYGKLIK